MTLTPAIMALLGDKAWWMPKWLNRLTPNMDVEGAALSEKIQHERESAAGSGNSQASVTASIIAFARCVVHLKIYETKGRCTVMKNRASIRQRIEAF